MCIRDRLWGETILYSMCILEEMQWKRTRSITSHDFFHGTLEMCIRDRFNTTQGLFS